MSDWKAKLGASLGLTILVIGTAAARSNSPVPCPMRTEPYSIDSPMMDILLNPKSVEVVESVSPGFVKKFPKPFMDTEAPSFSAILSFRAAATMVRLPQEKVDQIATGLTAVPVTIADQDKRCSRYEADARTLAPAPGGHPKILLFDKSTGYRDGPSVEAARRALETLAQRNGWSLTHTERSGSFTTRTLRQFDLVIWSNVSGDVLTVPQRRAFRSYIEQGGGFLGIHGSAGDPVTFWPWYIDTLIGARFAGHPMNPQFQEAAVIVDDPKSAIVAGLAPGWKMTDEWYSFKNNPRQSGAHILLRLDEASYQRKGFGSETLDMGADHPIAWSRCVGSGRSFYSAIGHVPATYAQPQNVTLLENAIRWASGNGQTECKRGVEVTKAVRPSND